MLKFAILGLLSYKPLSGYELTKRFTASVVFFWHAKHSQIYLELKRMQKEGLVTSRTEIQETKPNKKVYMITEKGKEQLINWIRKPTELQPLKDELLLKTFSFDLISSKEAVDQLDYHKLVHEERYKLFNNIKKELYEKYGGLEEIDLKNLSLFCRYLTLELGIRREKMYIDWCRWAIEEFLTVETRKKRPKRLKND